MMATRSLHIIKDANKKPIILELAIPTPIYSTFEYATYYKEKLTVGARVLAPFGKANRIVVGIIVKIKSKSNFDINKLKLITEIIDRESTIPEPHLKLLQWASIYYKYPIGLALECAIPTWLRKDNSLSKLSEKNQNDISEIDILDNKIVSASKHILSKDQELAIEKIISNINNFAVFCLFGVTGSGKTEVYLQAIQNVILQNKQALILIPEIGLSSQTIHRFKSRFNVEVAVIHSKLSDKQKATNWYKAANGIAKIIIGTRSASLIPLNNPGIFIIDEEHDSSFKQQDNFRYSAKDFLVKRAKDLNIPIILGSATPALETLVNTENNKYQLLKLPNRANNTEIPNIQLLDTRHKKLNAGICSELIAKIKIHLENHGQIILFLNRRGFAPALYCLECNWISECNNCDANLIVHFNKNIIVCHHCNVQMQIPNTCPKCSQKSLVPVGVGTERVYNKLTELFPDKNILRLDKDTTSSKNSMSENLELIRNKKIDIIIGTQMIAKGHHFDNITLVGILDIDAAFYSSDFRAIEKTGQLIVQVAGRAGRENNPSINNAEVLLQTTNIENPVLQLIATSNYLDFANFLLSERKAANLPPYSYQALFRAEAKTMKLVLDFLNLIKIKIVNNPILVLGPIPAPMLKRKNNFRAQLLLQSESRANLHKHIDLIIAIIASMPIKKFNRIRWSLDIDPQDLY